MPSPFHPSASRLAHTTRTKHTGGFTYLALLILLAIIGIAASATLHVGAIAQRRAAEEQLLSIGRDFRRALISYGNATPVGQSRIPRTLQDLLKDPRYPNPVRHLRQIYIDPMTGNSEWGLVPAINGAGIVGIFSLSEAKPIKIGNFEPGLENFADALTYRDWRFLADARNAPQNVR